jgi:ABC-type amino acid transport substrate-binding protein
MVKIYTSFRKIHRYFFSRRARPYLIAALSFLILALIMRSCSVNRNEKTSFRIGRDNHRYSIKLMEKERSVGGFSDDLLTAIANEEKIHFTLFKVPYEQQLAKLILGQVDGVISSLQPVSQSNKSFLFSDPYFLVGPVLIVAKETELGDFDGTAPKVVGIIDQSAAILEVAKKKSIRLQLYEDGLRALADLKNGRIDGVILSALPAYIYTRTFYSGQLKVVTAPLTDEGLHLIALNDDEGKILVEHFNRGLSYLKENNLYDELLNKWGLINVTKVDSLKSE